MHLCWQCERMMLHGKWIKAVDLTARWAVFFPYFAQFNPTVYVSPSILGQNELENICILNMGKMSLLIPIEMPKKYSIYFFPNKHFDQTFVFVHFSFKGNYQISTCSFSNQSKHQCCTKPWLVQSDWHQKASTQQVCPSFEILVLLLLESQGQV